MTFDSVDTKQQGLANNLPLPYHGGVCWVILECQEVHQEHTSRIGINNPAATETFGSFDIASPLKLP